jgi:predicted dehydrogenase
LRIGILGAGMIATVDYGYLPGLRRLAHRVEVAAIASRTRSRAEAIAREWGIPCVFDTLEGMLGGADLDAVINLTPIPAHYETSMQILAAGKHLITEKPLASSMAEADDICALAERSGLLVLCAPTDPLKREWIEARRLVAEGALGKIAFARVQSSHAGPAGLAWPTDPTWFYQKGAGSLLDIGVYGIDRITGVLGPATAVAAMSGITTPVRSTRGGPFSGTEIPVTADDNTLALLDFGGSTFAAVDGTFNVVASKSPEMELYGLAGTMIVNRPEAHPQPGQLPIELYRFDAAPGLDGWITPHAAGFTPRDPAADYARAVLADHLADCLEQGLRPVPSAERARHVLEIMLACRTAAEEGRTVTLTTSF